MDLQPHDQKNQARLSIDDQFEDFDFKPITTGLGFHHQQKVAEVSTVVREKVPTPAFQSFEDTTKREASVYQNDLSLFYQPKETTTDLAQIFSDNTDVSIVSASRGARCLAYGIDLLFISLVSTGLLTAMSLMAGLDPLVAMNDYAHEVTPIVTVIFFGLYFMYFSIFEMVSTSTIGKSIMSLKVIDQDGRSPRLVTLMLRTFISILNLASLGLFSYFDLQDKVTATSVVKN